LTVAVYTRTHEITPWGGTVSDLVSLATETRRLVAKTFNEDEGNIGLTVAVYRRDRADTYDDLEEFESDLTGDIRSIKTIEIVTHPPESVKKDARASVHFCIGIHAWAQVDGSDQVRVTGLATALRDVLARGRRRGRWLRRAPFVLGGAAIGLWVIGSVVFSFVRSTGTAGNVAGAAIVVLFISAGVCAALWKWAIPGVELRLPGEPTKIERFGLRPLKWVGITVAAACVTGAIAAIITLAVK
jgi:hypothetical protein